MPPQIIESTKASGLIPCHSGEPIASASDRRKSKGVFHSPPSSSIRRIGLPLHEPLDNDYTKLVLQLSQNYFRWQWVPAQGRDAVARAAPYSAAICLGAGGGLTRSAASWA